MHDHEMSGPYLGQKERHVHLPSEYVDKDFLHDINLEPAKAKKSEPYYSSSSSVGTNSDGKLGNIILLVLFSANVAALCGSCGLLIGMMIVSEDIRTGAIYGSIIGAVFGLVALGILVEYGRRHF